MAKADFCFHFYDGDATRDMAHMNRLERGAYMDVLVQQRQRGHLTKDDLKKFLSKDFDLVWGALEWVLKKDAAGKFYIEWLDVSEQRAKTHSKLQKDRRSGKTKQQPQQQSGNQTVLPEGDGNGYGNGSERKLEGEDEKLRDYEKWTTDIHDGNDHVFQPMYLNSGLKLDPGRYSELVRDHFELLCRYPKMRPSSQQAFRNSVLKHLRENQTSKINGTTGSKNGQHGVDAAKRDFAERASAKSAGT